MNDHVCWNCNTSLVNVRFLSAFKWDGLLGHYFEFVWECWYCEDNFLVVLLCLFYSYLNILLILCSLYTYKNIYPLFVFLHFTLIFLFLYPNNLYTFSSKLLILASCHVLEVFTGSGVVYIISYDLQRFKLLVSYKRRTCRKFKGFSRDRSRVKEAFKAALHLLNGKRCMPQQIFTHSGWEIFPFRKWGCLILPHQTLAKEFKWENVSLISSPGLWLVYNNIKAHILALFYRFELAVPCNAYIWCLETEILSTLLH